MSSCARWRGADRAGELVRGSPGRRLPRVRRHRRQGPAQAPREMPDTTAAQWAALRRAQALVAPGQPTGRPGRSLRTNTS
jgi:hypothetical protein